jgi:uncharacterized membrane protein
MPQVTPEVTTFPRTRQGLRNLDEVRGPVLPVSGGPAPRRPGVNLSRLERNASAALGGLLALFGLARGTLPGLAAALAGGALLYRGLSGHCHVYEALGLDTSGRPAAESREEVVYRAR